MWKQVSGWLLTAMIVFAMVYMIFSDNDTSLVTEKAEMGVLDLRELSNNDLLMSLSGEWKFTPNDFINPETFHSKADNQLVPQKWNSNAQYGSYQLKIYLPNHLTEIGFRVRNIWSAHTVFINGEKLSEVGKIGTTKNETIPKNPSYEFFLKPKTEELLVTIHVSNFYNARGGIIFPIDFGDAETMKKDVQDDYTIEWTAIFLLFVFSVFHLTIYLLRKKDVAFFYSGIYFLSLAMIVMTRGERVLLRKLPDLSFGFYFRFQDSVTFFSLLLLMLFIMKTIPSVMKKKQMTLLISPVILYAVAILLLPARSLSSLQYIFFHYMNIVAIIVILRIIIMIYKKQWVIPKNESIILSLMLLFLLMFSVSGALDQLFISGVNSLNRIGLLGFVISMNVFLGIRLINRTTEAENLNERLEKANIAKEAFLQVTTQELKNPLFHAINLTKSIHDDDKSLKRKTQLHIVEQLLERLLYLVNDLQDFTRIRFQDYSFELQSTNVGMVVRHIAQLMSFSFSKKNSEFHEQIPSSLHVLADENRLSQVFYRIVEECSSYALNGKIIAEAHHVNEVVHLTFEGIGENPYSSLEPSKEMGLLIGKELLERMNGHLHIEQLENGIRFTVKLPFYEYKKMDAMQKEQDESWSSTNLDEQDRPKVLIVEDDAIHAEVLSSLLSEFYTVTIAYSALDALKLLKQKSVFSLIVLDDVMPNMDGIELAKLIRQKSSLMELPIIMMTSNDYPTTIETIFAAGANDYFVKPVTKQAILARLNAFEQTKRAMTRAIESEMAFLQAQIKPHFLYNALSSIISFCYTDGERAAHLLTMLSSYLRYIFESGKEGHFSSLQKELDIIEAYIEIEKARFGERLSFSYEIDSSLNLKQIHIPSLLIQPLVENAIRHGLFEKEGNGHVQLNIKRMDDLLYIQLIDDGVGMSEEKCIELVEGTGRHKGIGFPNVLRRVREISNGSLTFHSIEGKGTTMNVTIPLKENEHVESHSR